MHKQNIDSLYKKKKTTKDEILFSFFFLWHKYVKTWLPIQTQTTISVEVTDIHQFISGFPLSTKKCFLAFLAVSLAMLCFLVHFPKNSYQPSLQRIKPPVPEAIQIKDPIFKKSCYSYSNIVATNKCCKMLEYDFPLLEKCLKTFNATRKWVGLFSLL